MVYQIVLQDAGFECISYIDPVKALKEFRSNYYDLILLDIKMPVLNGFELCKKIIEIDKTVHIIFITASEEYYENFRKQYYSQLHDSGTNINYVQKPIGNDELIQMVNTISGTTTTVALSQNEDGRMLNDIRFTSKKQEKEAGEGGNNNIFTIQ
jgi:two-component SAPR family response regulator